MNRFRIPVAGLALVALGGLLSACGTATGTAGTLPRSGASATGSQPATSPAPRKAPSGTPSAPVTGKSISVRLDGGFSPSSVTLAVGQRFELTVSDSVKAGGLDCDSAGGLLRVSCPGGGVYVFTAERQGSTVVSTTVRPNCSGHSLCPQWIALPRLKIIIT